MTGTLTHTAPAVVLRRVSKVYGTRSATVTALDDVTLDFGRGRLTAVMGPSGSGWSTLLHCAAGLDRPTSGEIVLAGTSLAGLGETRLTKLRPAGRRPSSIRSRRALRRRVVAREAGTLPTPA